jgi:hypothetical protein
LATKPVVAAYDDYIYKAYSYINYNYSITAYGKKTSIDEIFESGTTPGTSNFTENTTDFNNLYKAYASGYKAYFTQEFLGNTTVIPSFFQISSTSMFSIYNAQPSFFFTVTGNNTSFNTIPSGYNYGICYINGSGTIKFNTDTVVNLWMVGGGGGGGCNSYGSGTLEGAGGGGAGGVINFNFPMKQNITYSFTIGAGGSGGSGSRINGNNGLKTSLSWTDGNLKTIDVSGGGGGAGGNAFPAPSGGSGGGACYYQGTYPTGGVANKKINVNNGPITYSYTNNIISGPGTNGVPIIGNYSSTFTDNTNTNVTYYANNGGSRVSGTIHGGAGGGGAGAAGTNITSNAGTAGGAGITILGTVDVGGGGGGGSGDGSSVAGAGGSGGGGAGVGGGGAGGDGVANTGGGGGGSCDYISTSNYSTGGNGGSGVVYIFF